MKKKSLFNLSVSLTFFFIIVLSFFLYIDNLNFLYKKNSFIQNTILNNSAVGDSFDFYNNHYTVYFNFKAYLNDIVYNFENKRFYPSNNYNFGMFINLFDRNIHLIYAFNLFFYLYFFYKFTFFFQKNFLVTYCILSSLNILILGSLSTPNKEILCYFSFNAFLLYYLKRDYKFLFIAFFFGAVSRHELIILYILILIINSNFFLQINNFLIKKSKFFFIIFTYILMHLISLFFFTITIDIFIKFLFFYIFKIFFFYIFLRFFIKKIDNYLFCKISYIALFIIFLSIFVTKYYWFIGSGSLLTNNIGSFGLSKLIHEICVEGFFFIIYPFKILISLFGNIFQKINFTSYETILSYWSQLLFFILFFFIIVKRNFTKNLDFLFAIFPILIVFSTPAFHTHRYVWFVYQYFVLTSLLSKDLKK
jgi:hypothetical protein